MGENNKASQPNPSGQSNSEDSASVGERLEGIVGILGEMKKQLNGMEILMKEFQNLKDEIGKKDQVIKSLTNRVDELEQQNKLNEVIVTGLMIKPRIYARATASEQDPEDEVIKSVETQVVEFLSSKDIALDLENVDSCHLLPKRKVIGTQVSLTRAVMLRFSSMKQKVALLKQGKKLKGSTVFINENLTKRNASIAWKTRQLKKSGKIQNTWTANCKIYIKPMGTSPESTKPVLIREMEDLEKFDH